MTIEIAYVGKKPAAYDNVAKSGKCWNGYGDTQFVTPDQARVLLRYPDQWALAHEEDAFMVNAPTSTVVQGEDGQSVRVMDSELTKPLEKMSKSELAAFAKAKFGKKLDARKATKELIDTIEEFERDLEPVAVVG